VVVVSEINDLREERKGVHNILELPGGFLTLQGKRPKKEKDGTGSGV